MLTDSCSCADRLASSVSLQHHVQVLRMAASTWSWTGNTPRHILMHCASHMHQVCIHMRTAQSLEAQSLEAYLVGHVCCGRSQGQQDAVVCTVLVVAVQGSCGVAQPAGMRCRFRCEASEVVVCWQACIDDGC